jgi:ectoine hydroxylase-related dioxygenase (phytanoyl-CoA dioxygenase family)
MNSEFRIQNLESNDGSQSEQVGFQIFKSVFEDGECDSLSAELTPFFEQQQQASKNRIGGLRNLLRNHPRVLKLSKSAKLLSIVKQFGGSAAFPVRAIFFDKNPAANWVVSWHQDLAIAVVERIETPGFTGWSVKDGTIHVHPPREILESMVTVRLHLDDCNASNGALKVLPRTHHHGKLDAADIQKWTAKSGTVVCELAKGDAMLMRPLLLHASSPAENPRHRRVLHIEYATVELPNGLKWFDRL